MSREKNVIAREWDVENSPQISFLASDWETLVASTFQRDLGEICFWEIPSLDNPFRVST